MNRLAGKPHPYPSSPLLPSPNRQRERAEYFRRNVRDISGGSGLTKSISLDGRAFGIACGQIDIGNAATELTERFSRGVLQANGAVAAEPTFDSRHVADAVLYMASLPLEVNVQFLTITATTMPYIGRG